MFICLKFFNTGETGIRTLGTKNCTIDLFSKERIILVEKRGIVVQLVRAPPCHGGSCEFESRQSRLAIEIQGE